MSNAFLARFSAIADRAFKRVGLADDATYKQTSASTPVACVVYIDRDVQQIGALAEPTDLLTVLRVSSSSVSKPPIGATFTVGSETFTVDRIQAADEGFHVCIVTVSP